MKCREIIEILDGLAPEAFACDWDNPGLLAGSREKEVKKILLTVDADDKAVERAVKTGADLLISHHPLIFKPIRHVTAEDFIGRRLIAMVRADITYYAMHTNFDAAPGCMADLAAERIGLLDCVPLEEMGETESGRAYGIGCIGRLPEPETGMKLAKRVKEKFSLPFAAVYGQELYEEKPAERIAVCPGAGGSEISQAVKKGAQVLITGDIGHHTGIDAAAQGLMVIDAGHYGLEYVFMDFMEQYLKERLSGNVQIEKMPVEFPAALV